MSRQIVVPLTTRELAALECARRSGLSPTDETVDRLIAYARSLETALRWQAWREEDEADRIGVQVELPGGQG